MKIFLDLDGVVVNWAKAALNLCGVQDDHPEVTQALTREYDAVDKLVGWPILAEAIKGAGFGFWENLEFLPWGRDLVDKASKAGGDNFAFVTSPGRFGFAPTGKFNWRQKNYPDLNLVITKSKHLLAAPDAILIDDDGRQIEAFDKAGGKGFLWPSQYQLRKDDKYLVATYQNLSKLITDVATK